MTILALLAELLPAVLDLASDVVEAGDDEKKLEEARLRHDRRVSDAIMRASLGLPGAP